MIQSGCSLILLWYLTSIVTTTDLEDLYKLMKKSQQKHGKFIRPLRNVDTGQPMIIAKKTIDLFVKTQPKFKRQLNSTALSVTNRDSKFEERNMSPESWLKKFYRKSIIPRKTKSISDKIEENQNNTVSDTVFPERIALVKDETETNDTRKGVINQPEPLVIDQVVNSDDYDNFEEEDDEGIYDYEYVIFINKQKDENEDVEILDELDDTPPPPDSDFNTINMYNNLYKLASFNPDSSPVVSQKLVAGFKVTPAELHVDEPSSETTTKLDLLSTKVSDVQLKLSKLLNESATTSTESSSMELAELFITTSASSDVSSPNAATTTDPSTTTEELSTKTVDIDVPNTTYNAQDTTVEAVTENEVDTDNTKEALKIKSVKKQDRFERLKKKKVFRDQLKHFYETQFQFKVKDLDPFPREFEFDFNRRNPVNAIRENMAEIFRETSQLDGSASAQLQKARTNGPNDFLHPFNRGFSQFDDFQNVNNLVSSNQRLPFKIPREVEENLFNHWSSLPNFS